MQLTKDDLTRLDQTYLDYSKFQQVVAFYEKYKDKDWCEELTPLWINRKLTERNWNDWLFNYCFKDGLK